MSNPVFFKPVGDNEGWLYQWTNGASFRETPVESIGELSALAFDEEGILALRVYETNVPWELFQ